MKIITFFACLIAVANCQGFLPQVPFLPQVDTNVDVSLPSAVTKIAEVPLRQLESFLEASWGDFKTKFNKIYSSPEEEKFRKEVFIENMNTIERLNRDYSTGKTTFFQQLNDFADVLHHEFNRNLNGFNRTGTKPNIPDPSYFIPSANAQIPDQIDWRDLGAVTPVKYQGMCGGCYAFSAAGAIEGHHFRKTGQLIELSPQNFIDCTQPYDNDGCNGGLMDPAFQYAKENPGVDTEASYPFEGTDGNNCRYTPEGLGAITTGFVVIPPGDEEALKNAVATLGPVSVAIDAGQNSFQFYSNGVYFESECKNTIEDMNHAVLVVGYGVEPDGKEYWLVKNSYGTTWGIGGYIKMARNANNHCGIANIASYPLV